MGCYFRLLVSFDGGESLDKNIHDLKEGKWFSFCILQLPKKLSPWSLNLSDPCFIYFFNGPLSLRMLLSTSSRILNNG